MRFSNSVLKNLGYYVYALVDPDTDTVFYIGKGKGNRIFDHIKEASKPKNLEKDDVNDDENRIIHKKLVHINKINNGGLNRVGMFIIRHGLTNEHAFIVESVLIDLFQNKSNLKFDKLDGLDNLMKGYQSQGVNSIEDIEKIYNTEPADIGDLKILAININIDSRDEQEIYKRVRGDWKLAPDKANKAQFIVATHSNLIVGVFERTPEKAWYKSDNPAEDHKCRYRFDGFVSNNEDVRNRLYMKTIERKAHCQNPIKYFNIK